MSTSPQLFDLIVIGAGPGGYSLAAEASHLGKKVALVEREHLGGTCLNHGCIPTKALCHSAVHSPSEGIDPALGRKAKVVEELREGVATLLGSVSIFSGEATLGKDHTVEVCGETLAAPQIVIATGSQPAILPIPGAELALTSTEMLQLSPLPASLAIIGGGVIGMEFASMMSGFGVEVSVVEYCPEILPPFDAEIAKRLRMSMKRRGVNIITSAAVTALRRVDDGMVEVAYTAKGKEKTLLAATVLMAVGRRPLLPKGVEEAGIALDRRGFIVTDNDMRTSVEGIYAIGDVNGRCLLAHAAEAQGRRVLGLPVDLSVIPSVVFTNPPCSMAGMTEKECVDSGITPLVGTATFRANGYAVATDQTEGLVKMLFHPSTLKLLGCHIFGAGADLMVSTASVAMTLGATLEEMQKAVYPHPTLGETLSAAARNVK